jgi:hypothetical protein
LIRQRKRESKTNAAMGMSTLLKKLRTRLRRELKKKLAKESTISVPRPGTPPAHVAQRQRIDADTPYEPEERQPASRTASVTLEERSMDADPPDEPEERQPASRTPSVILEEGRMDAYAPFEPEERKPARRTASVTLEERRRYQRLVLGMSEREIDRQLPPGQYTIVGNIDTTDERPSGRGDLAYRYAELVPA